MLSRITTVTILSEDIRSESAKEKSSDGEGAARIVGRAIALEEVSEAAALARLVARRQQSV